MRCRRAAPSGAQTIVLIEPEEIDAAAKKAGTLDYHPPGT
jgi:hypothetical protein